MRAGLVCGDGLPVSGLLTIFRNVVELGREMGILEVPVPADLGFSWRPDKGTLFPSGNNTIVYPDWMSVADCPAAVHLNSATFATELISIREDVARLALLSISEKKRLKSCIADLTTVYYEHFMSWLKSSEVDWVFALNVTLSDAVPVTVALHSAIRDHFSGGRRGGILFWDHDLFQSCAIRNPDSGARVYPEKPNEFTPLPRRNAFTRWVVVSDALAEETAHYPTDLLPEIVPNILPTIPVGMLDARHWEYARRLDLDARRPILLDPVRMFRVKGVHVAVELLAAIKLAAERRGIEIPYLLVFGSLQEDPEYAQEVVALARDLNVLSEVRFLDGVPLTSHREADGRWRLDEVDLLRLSAASCGGVVFTPGVPDVETVGLGPGLAALAGLPCAVTDYDAFERVYGSSFVCIRVRSDPGSVYKAGEELLNVLQGVKQRDMVLLDGLKENLRTMESRFPVAPWRNLWREMEEVLVGGGKERGAGEAVRRGAERFEER
jgi:hypothetical protein